MRKTPIGMVLPFALLFAIIFAAGCCGLEDFMGDGGNISINNWTMPQRNLTSSLHGTVTNLKKAPLEGATILLIGDVSNYTRTSDANGRYNISGIRAGTYEIIVWKSGYRNMTLPIFTILGGYSYPWNVSLYSMNGELYGRITNLKNESLENVSILLIGNASNYTGLSGADGRYNVSGVRAGIYDVIVWKAGRKNVTLANFTFLGEQSYAWNVTSAKDCLYYSVNTSTNYVLRYGFNGTIYRGKREFALSYPEGATYDVYPTSSSGLSKISTAYLAGSRVLEWTLDNSNGDYSYVQGYVYVNMDGTGTMQLYDRREMGIPDASSGQPGYLGSETDEDGDRMIDPSNSEIRAIAQQVKNETGSDDAWTVARALFIWLKSNTVYYIDPQTSDYSHLPTETLHSGRGKCDELSHLYISMLRSVGIPSRFVTGYIAERNPGRYLSHRWVEFYDGEWVPVEVAGSGNASNGANTNFAVQQPDHVEVFTDDGTDESMPKRDFSTGVYYDQPDAFPYSIYYDAIDYNEMYIAACSDGTREFKNEME